MLAEAVALQKAGKLDAAAGLYRRLLERTPGLVPALCLLANIERQQGELSLAADHLRRALEAGPEVPAALQESGLLAMATDRPEDAVRHLRKLVTLRPDYPDGHFNLGHALERSHQPAQALVAYQAAIRHGAREAWEPLTRIGSCLVALGREQEASHYFEEALALAPGFSPALFGQGMVRMAYGDFTEAGRLFEAALQADPARIEIYQQVVELRKYTSMDEPLVRSMQTSLADPALSEHTREKLHFALGKVANDCGEHDTAFGHYAAAKLLKKNRQPVFERAKFATLTDRIADAFPGLPPLSMAGQGALTPVFIIGMPRSGTTLAEQILSCHSMINGAGELAFMEGLARQEASGYPERVTANGEAWQRASRDAYLNELTAFAEGVRYVTDKYPANFLHVGLIATLFPEARFIHCRRNPLDTCLSIFFQDFSTGNYYANDLDDIAFYYTRYARLMQHWEKVAADRIHVVQYEDLIDDQEKQTRSLLGFLGLEWEAACLRFHENPRKVSTMSRWQVRQPVYTGSVERWRRYEKHLGKLIDALPGTGTG